MLQCRIASGVLLLGASAAVSGTLHAQDGGPPPQPESGQALSLEAISVSAPSIAQGNEPAAPYAGGQVAAGARIGVLGQQEAVNVPFNVVSFTDKLIRNQQADTVADVLLNDAAVQTGFGFGNYSELYVIRGFRLNGEDIAFGGLYGVLPRQVVATNFVERVELFKGANAFANGVTPTGSGVGGAINLVPKVAGAEPVTRLRFGYASESYGEVPVDAARRYGDDEQFGARVNLQYGAGDTAIVRENRRNTSATVAFDYEGERSRALLFLGYQELVVDGGRSILQLGDDLDAIPEPPDADTNYTPAFAYSDLETTFGMLRGGYDLNDTWTAYAAIGANDTNESGQYSSPTIINADGDVTAARLGVPYEAQAFAGQTGLRGYFLTGPVSHQINVGYSGFYRKTSTAFTFGASQPTNIYDPADLTFPETISSSGNLDDPNVRSRTRSDGIALSDTLGFLDDRVLLTLGARYQDIEIKNYEYDGSFRERFADDGVSPVYGIVVKPWRHVSLYANHIEALQPGGTAPPVAENAGESIGIAESTQNEVGVKYDRAAFGGALALYEIEQPNAFVDPNTNVFGYNGEQRNRGVEISFYGEPVDGVRLLTSATWIDADMTRTENGVNEGNTAVGVPDYRLGLGGEWDLPGADRWTALGQVIHNGSQFADAANELEVDGWTRLDLGLRYRMPLDGTTVVWRANVENVTDAEYWASAFGGYLSQGDPRTFKLSATFDF